MLIAILQMWVLKCVILESIEIDGPVCKET